MWTVFTDTGYQYLARKVHRDCSALREMLEREDFFAEAVRRFDAAVERSGEVRHGKAFFRRICQDHCYERTRRLREPETEIPVDELPVDELFAKLSA